MVNRDTVEEFWDEEVLSELTDQGPAASPAEFARALGEFLQTAQQVWLTASGRAGLYGLLALLKSPEKSAVLISDFNCPAVADAVLRAGLQVETFDLADHTGRIDWEAVCGQLSPRHAAVVVPHLFGVPTDFSPVVGAAARLGICVIEDCAHTLGGRIGQQMAGTLGDAAIFSFNYDKPLSLGGGGAVVINHPDLAKGASFPAQEVSAAVELGELRAFRRWLTFRRSNIRGRSLPFRVARRLLRMTGTYRQPCLTAAAAVGPVRAALGLWQLRRYLEIVRRRNENAQFFRDVPGCTAWHVGPGTQPAWLRLKILPRTPGRAADIACLLQRRGLRVGPFNWSQTIGEYLGQQASPTAGYLARCALDVPIHQAMTRAELEHIAAVLQA
jgi:dTDP-4-amino-4,6-dideoxygalactose transaminase